MSSVKQLETLSPNGKYKVTGNVYKIQDDFYQSHVGMWVKDMNGKWVHLSIHKAPKYILAEWHRMRAEIEVIRKKFERGEMNDYR